MTHSIYNSLLRVQLRLPQILLRGELNWIVPFPDSRFGYLLLQGLSKHVLVGYLYQGVGCQILAAQID